VTRRRSPIPFTRNVRRYILPKNHVRSLPQSFWIPLPIFRSRTGSMEHAFAPPSQPDSRRRHPTTRTFGTTRGRTTLVQLSSHELHSLPSSSPLGGPLGSRTRLNEFRRFSSLGVFGNPLRSLCDYRPPQYGYFNYQNTQWNISYLKLIDESSCVLEYDAVLTVNDEFR
jgi:hypothetical protein